MASARRSLRMAMTLRRTFSGRSILDLYIEHSSRLRIRTDRYFNLSHLRVPQSKLDGDGDECGTDDDADPRRRARQESQRIEQAPDTSGSGYRVVVDDRRNPGCMVRHVVKGSRNVAERSISDRGSHRVSTEEPTLQQVQSQRRKNGPEYDGAFRPRRYCDQPTRKRQVPDSRCHDQVHPQGLELQPYIGLPQRATEGRTRSYREDECDQQRRDVGCDEINQRNRYQAGE